MNLRLPLIYSVILLLFVALTQCKKDVTQLTGTPLIKTDSLTQGAHTYTTYYYYDEQGRVKSTVGYPHFGTPDEYTYTYHAAYVLKLRTAADTIVATPDTTELDSRGLTTRYTFDADGYMQSSSTDTYEWADGNLMRIKDQNGDVNATYTYYTDKTNTIGYANYGNVFYGKSPRNPVASTNTTMGNYTYTYTYDQYGRITSSTQFSSFGSSTRYYTYY